MDLEKQKLVIPDPEMPHDIRIPYGPRRSELQAMAAKLKMTDYGHMTRDELVDAMPAKKKGKK